MEWIKVSLQTTPWGIEVATGILMNFGIHGVEIVDSSEMRKNLEEKTVNWDYLDDTILAATKSKINPVLSFYIGTDSESMGTLRSFKEKIIGFDHGCEPIITEEKVDDQDWLHEWKKHFHEMQIGKIVILPEWEPCNIQDDRIVFTIDPGSAFGTGQHPTTAMCIEQLQHEISENDIVLDIGCGSGILSIISLLLGSSSVACCDIDPSVKDVVVRNAMLNPVSTDDLKIYIGDILVDDEVYKKIANQKYDIVIANIVADVIIALVPLIPRLLKPAGVFIASGIIIERLEEVKSTFAQNNLTIKSTITSDGWCCITAHG